MDKIQGLFDNYKQKYLLANKEFVIERMLDDGVITFEDAKNLREGNKTIFSFENYSKFNIDENLSTTELMGGYFQLNRLQKKISIER